MKDTPTMGDAPRLTDKMLALQLGDLDSIAHEECLIGKDAIKSMIIELQERRAQSEGAQAKVVVEKLMKICTQDLLHEPDIAGDIMKVIDEHLSPPRQTEEAAGEPEPYVAKLIAAARGT